MTLADLLILSVSLFTVDNCLPGPFGQSELFRRVGEGSGERVLGLSGSPALGYGVGGLILVRILSPKIPRGSPHGIQRLNLLLTGDCEQRWGGGGHE